MFYYWTNSRPLDPPEDPPEDPTDQPGTRYRIVLWDLFKDGWNGASIVLEKEDNPEIIYEFTSKDGLNPTELFLDQPVAPTILNNEVFFNDGLQEP